MSARRYSAGEGRCVSSDCGDWDEKGNPYKKPVPFLFQRPFDSSSFVVVIWVEKQVYVSNNEGNNRRNNIFTVLQPTPPSLPFEEASYY